MRLSVGEIEFARNAFIRLSSAGVMEGGEALYELVVYLPNGSGGTAKVPAAAMEALAMLAIQALTKQGLSFHARLMEFLTRETK